jgi:hypothetical protein
VAVIRIKVSDGLGFMAVLLARALAPVTSFGQLHDQMNSCPSDPDKLRSMIDELKTTFECSGLNLRTCNQYRSTVAVGGALAGSVAAGLAVLKNNPGIKCGLGTNSVSGKISFLRHRIIEEAQASPAGGACTISKDVLAKDFDRLKRDFQKEGERLNADLRERLIAQQAGSVDASKIAVTGEEMRSRMLQGLDALDAEIRASNLSVEARQSLYDIVADERKALRATSGGALAGKVADTYQRLTAYMPLSLKEGLSSQTQTALSYWKLGEEKRAKAATASVEKAVGEVDRLMASLSNFTSNQAKYDFLKGKGYNAQVIESIMEVEAARVAAGRYATSLQMANHKLSTTAFRGGSQISVDELRKFSRSHFLSFLEQPLFAFREVPGLNNGLAATVGRAGKTALAKVTASGAQGLSKVAGVAGSTLMVAGKVVAAPAFTGAEIALHTGDVDCRGQRVSQYGVLRPFENENGATVCRAGDERTDKTDEFLFDLSFEEQLSELRNDFTACDMLVGLHARYAPSANWSVTCSANSKVQLNTKNTKGEGQMVRFDVANGLPANLEWHSTSWDRCAKVQLNDDGSFTSGRVFQIEDGKSCGEVGFGTPVSTGRLARTRADGAVAAKSKKMASEFIAWHETNSYLMTAAADCCSGRQGNPMCELKSGRGGDGGSGASGVRTHR